MTSSRDYESASSEYDAAVKELPKCALCGKVLVINLFGPIKLCCKGVDTLEEHYNNYGSNGTFPAW